MDASQISDRLADMAEAVCRHYLPNGRREGRSWRVGDARNAPGRSLVVRLVTDTAGRRAGKWQDLSTGEHGDLLDLIREAKGLSEFRDVVDEAKRFLADPPQVQVLPTPQSAHAGSPLAARRLFDASQPIQGTLAEAYLRRRGISDLRDIGALRYHPRCYYGAADAIPNEAWPALIASVTDNQGCITGVHRVYLDPNGYDAMRLGKAPVECPKRSLGEIHGHGVRFGRPSQVLAAGEGIETVRSLKDVLPSMPMISALSSAHLAELALPPGIRHLYVVQDNDAPGADATRRLIARAEAVGISASPILPRGGDLNDDLRTLGRRSLCEHVALQLRAEHIELLVSSW